jgi:hypothetical protein
MPAGPPAGRTQMLAGPRLDSHVRVISESRPGRSPRHANAKREPGTPVPRLDPHVRVTHSHAHIAAHVRTPVLRLDPHVRVMSESRLEQRLGGEATRGRPAGLHKPQARTAEGEAVHVHTVCMCTLYPCMCTLYVCVHCSRACVHCMYVYTAAVHVHTVCMCTLQPCMCTLYVCVHCSRACVHCMHKPQARPAEVEAGPPAQPRAPQGSTSCRCARCRQPD